MTQFSKLSVEEQARVRELLEQLKSHANFNKLDAYEPYEKQIAFHSLSANHREALLLGGNQTGKTLCGSREMAFHLTGRYPKWWKGKRFNYPIRAKAASINFEMTRDGIQRNLLGNPEDRTLWGTGSLPKSCIEDVKMNSDIKGGTTVYMIKVKHISGGFSYITLSAYTQSRESWQADKLDLVWFDEEPPIEIYSEGKARTSKGNGEEHGYPESFGYVYTTFTPFKGISQVVGGFYPECKSPDKAFVQMGLYDVMSDPEKGIRGHYTKERVAQLLEGFEPWERDARGFGIPVLGDGAVFNVDWKTILCDPIPIPKHWMIINGIDFGWDHPSAGVQIAIDPDSGEKGHDGTIYVIDVFKKVASTAADFASCVKLWPGQWAWPHDGAQHEKSTGIVVAEEYRRQGLDMLHERATHDGKSNSLALSINECKTRFMNGQLKIFNTAAMKGGMQDSLLTELRQYHRIDGKVVPLKDDAIAAMRYAIMMRRFAKAPNEKDELADLIRQRNKKKRSSTGYI